MPSRDPVEALLTSHIGRDDFDAAERRMALATALRDVLKAADQFASAKYLDIAKARANYRRKRAALRKVVRDG